MVCHCVKPWSEVELASSPGHSHVCVTLKTWQWPGDEAKVEHALPDAVVSIPVLCMYHIIITSLVAIYFSEISNIFPVRVLNHEIWHRIWKMVLEVL